MKYTENSKNLNYYLKETFLFCCKGSFVLIGISFFFAIFYLYTGFCGDDNGFQIGGGFIFFGIIFILTAVKSRMVLKKRLQSAFRYVDSNGDLTFEVKKENGSLFIQNLSSGTVSRIEMIDVTDIVKRKELLFLKTTNGESIFFPYSIELLDFLKNN